MFQLVRQKIREYRGVSGWSFNTYEKATFIKNYTVTMYVPSQYGGMHLALIMGIICKKHPKLKKPYKVLKTSRFTTEGPGPVKGRRSRIGDTIVLLEGSKEFMEELATFPEEFRFFVSYSWKMTIRGGKRKGDAYTNNENADLAVSYTHLTLPTIYSV